MVLFISNNSDNFHHLAFILNGKNRCAIFRCLLEKPNSIAEIARTTFIPISNVSRVIKTMKTKAIVEKLTPDLTRGCLYQLTPLALELREEFEKYYYFRHGN